MQNVTTGVVYTEPPADLPADELADLFAGSVRELGAAGATSVVFQGSAEAPDPGPLIRAVGRSAELSAQGHR